MGKKLWLWIIPVALVAAGFFYYLNNPQQSALAPKCPVKLLTGYQCPSCGGQRAIHAFLHGRIAEAISYNLFFVIAIPVLLATAYAAVVIKRAHPSDFTRKLYNITTSRYTLLSYVALYFIWWLVRNLIGM